MYTLSHFYGLIFLAVHQRDVRFILDGNSAFLDKDKEIINFDRALMLGQCLWSVGCLRSPTAFYYPTLQKDDDLYSLLVKVRHGVHPNSTSSILNVSLRSLISMMTNCSVCPS